jgi:drug/metabolite transporter (DMT)-like permease
LRQAQHLLGPVALLALVGIAAMARAPLQDSLPLLSLVAAIGSAFCFAEAAIVVRRFPPVHPVTLNAVGMAAGSALLILGALLARESIEVPDRSSTWLALAYLVVVGSGLVFVLYVVVIRVWGAARAAYTFVVIPLVTIVLSAWLDDEPVGVGLVAGGLLVLAGVYVGALREPSAPQRPTDAEPSLRTPAS